MVKDYTVQLAEWVGQRASTRRDKNLVAFLAVRADVEAALNVGFAARTVWLNLYEEGRIPFRYTTFLNFIDRHIQLQKHKSKKSRGSLPSDERSINKNNLLPSVGPHDSEPIRGFVFNPIPKKEELI